MPISRVYEKQTFVIAAFRHDSTNAILYKKSVKPETIAKHVRALLENKDGAEVVSIRRVYQMVEEWSPVPELPDDPELVTVDSRK